MEITPGIRRIGSGIVNVYLIEEAGEVTIVDAGAPSYWRDLPTELAAMGRSLADVRAVVLTHAHPDHIGFAERIRRERGVPIRVHELDAMLARGKARAGGGLGGSSLGPLLAFAVWALRHGMARIPPIVEVGTFADGTTLDVPGAPRVIHVPGHTPGSAALHVASRDAIFIGDALVTLNVTTGATGPRISPFGADDRRALESLDRLAGLEARYVLPGHGVPWTAGLAEAVREVRRSSATSTRH